MSFIPSLNFILVAFEMMMKSLFCITFFFELRIAHVNCLLLVVWCCLRAYVNKCNIKPHFWFGYALCLQCGTVYLLHLHCVKLTKYVWIYAIKMDVIFSCKFILIWDHLSKKEPTVACLIYKSFFAKVSFFYGGKN